MKRNQVMNAVKLVAVVCLAVISPCHSGFVFDESEIQSEESILSLYARWSKHYNLSRSESDHVEKAKRFEAFKRTALSTLERPALNNLADMTAEEYKLLTSCVAEHPLPESDHEPAAFTGSLESVPVPASVDWRAEGAVLPVSDQGSCGSCWAFSAADTIASIRYINSFTKDLEQLSVQQLVDCVEESCGCKHGTVHSAFGFTTKNGGITTEENYPYKMKDDHCRTGQYYPMVKINGYQVVPRNDEGALRRAVAKQPVSASIDASSEAFRKYVGGIFSGPCNEKQGHQVTIVGYGSTSSGMDYWIVKNSWGTEWGDEGYMMLDWGQCRIAQQAVYPTQDSAVAY